MAFACTSGPKKLIELEYFWKQYITAVSWTCALAHVNLQLSGSQGVKWDVCGRDDFSVIGIILGTPL